MLKLEIHEGRKRYVYGAGFAGKIIAGYLTICCNQKVEAIVVSDGHKELDEYTYPVALSNTSIPIIEYGELNKEEEPIDFYLTLDLGKDEVCEKLYQRRDGGAVIDIAPFLSPIIEEYNQKVCEAYNIDLNTDTIYFKDVAVFNVLKDDPKFRRTFWETYGDEILPSVYNDNSLAIDGPYEINEYQVFINKGDVVFDIGANLGLFSCYASQKGCKVYAFDPDESCQKILKKQKKFYPSLVIVPAGLSDEVGDKEFYESEDCALSSMSRINDGILIKKIVQIDTIDHFVENNNISRIDYIKADIEGEERNMLKGATNVLRDMAPKLSICTYHYADDPVLLEKIIKEANPDYMVKHAWRKLYAYVPK